MPYDGSSRDDKDLGWQRQWDGSFIRALDTRTGKERWKAPRGPSRLGHVSPLVLRDAKGDVLVSCGGDVVQGFEPKTGKLLWTVRSEGEGVVPTPVVGEGLIFTASGFGKPTLRAVKPGGSGDATATHIAWEQTRNVPMIPSAVYTDGHLFAVSEKGIASCLKAKTGEVVWQQRIGGAFSASPLLAGGRIYCLAEDGETTVIEAKPVFKVLARNPIGETCQASPAAAHGCLFLRGERHLYCIGKP
jgi:outer membrane protein assembly factor BamB